METVATPLPVTHTLIPRMVRIYGAATGLIDRLQPVFAPS